MALTACRECGNQISELAASCPRCGAPALSPRTQPQEPNKTTCPVCHTAISIHATTCPGCHAKKGYTQANGVIYGPIRTVLFGILLPGFFALVAFSLAATYSSGVIALVGAFFALPVVLSLKRLITGPVWYSSNAPR